MKRLFFSLLLTGSVLSAADYVVTPADSLQKAFDRLKPGDTLTLQKGVYRQGTVKGSFKGTAAKPVIIRGADRDATFVTAWKSLDGARWEAVKGQRFVYRTPLKEQVYNVSDLNTERLLLAAPSVHDMERFNGTFLYQKGFLYLHPFDGKLPGRGLRATVNSGYLFLLQNAAHVRIENLTFCGSAYKDPRYSSWGIAIRCTTTSDVTVDNCRFFYNSGGVAFTVRSLNSTVRNSFFHRNDAPGYAEAAQLFFGGKSRNNLAENNIVLNTGVHGVRFYSGATDSTARNNIIVNARIGLYYKATAGKRLAQGNVVINCPNTNYSDLSGGRPIRDISNTFGYPSHVYDPNATNLILTKKSSPLFCAPEYNDFRLQKNAPSLGKGAFPKPASVFYLSPDGKDANDGGSVKTAFRTFKRALSFLKPGATLYIEKGKYDSFKGKLQNVTIRGRSDVTVGTIDFSGSENVTLEGISAAKIDLSGSKKAVLKNVTVSTLISGKETALYNCDFTTVSGTAAFYDCLQKGVSVGAVPESPLLPGVRKSALKRSGNMLSPRLTFYGDRATVSWITPGISADHYRMKDAWWAPQVCTSYVEYGPTAKLGQKAFSSGNLFHSAVLTNLKPGQKVFYRLVIPAHPLAKKALTKWEKAAFAGVEKTADKDIKSQLCTFTMPASDKRAAREIFVSPSGKANAAGTRQAPLGSVAQAVEQALPGDTVTFLPGIYYDTLMPIHPGTKAKSILFRAAKAGTVIFDGSNFMRPGGIVCKEMEHLKFQGFIFRNYANKLYANRAAGSFGMAQIYHSSHIELKDCVFSAPGTYQHPVVLLGSRDIKMENCAFVNGVSAIDGSRNGNWEVRNCTFYVSAIHNIAVSHQQPGSVVTVRNNLFVALTPVKALNCVERTGITGDGFKVDFDNNCWYFSPKDIYRYCGGEGHKAKLTGPAGVARFRAQTGWGKNDIETTSIRFKGHKFYDPSEKGFDQVTLKNLVSGKTVPTLEFFEAEHSDKYGVKAVK